MYGGALSTGVLSEWLTAVIKGEPRQPTSRRPHPVFAKSRVLLYIWALSLHPSPLRLQSGGDFDPPVLYILPPLPYTGWLLILKTRSRRLNSLGRVAGGSEKSVGRWREPPSI